MKRRKDFTHYPRWEDRVARRIAIGVGIVIVIYVFIFGIAKLAYDAWIAWGWWL